MTRINFSVENRGKLTVVNGCPRRVRHDSGEDPQAVIATV
jgi:hypothetical protein